jgi:hypothetical protein
MPAIGFLSARSPDEAAETGASVKSTVLPGARRRLALLQQLTERVRASEWGVGVGGELPQKTSGE